MDGFERPVRRVAVVGAGTIGASWAAYFLSRGLEVVASDPAEDAPALVARMIDTAWPVLLRIGATADADPSRWRFSAIRWRRWRARISCRRARRSGMR